MRSVVPLNNDAYWFYDLPWHLPLSDDEFAKFAGRADIDRNSDTIGWRIPTDGESLHRWDLLMPEIKTLFSNKKITLPGNNSIWYSVDKSSRFYSLPLKANQNPSRLKSNNLACARELLFPAYSSPELYPGKGAGCRIAVIDYGMSATAEGYDFSQRVQCVSPHGQKSSFVLGNKTCGIAPEAVQMLCPISIDITLAPVVAALIWAAKNGADLINVSLWLVRDKSFPDHVPISLRRAVDYCEEHQVLIIAAIGNSTEVNVSSLAMCSSVLAVGGTENEARMLGLPVLTDTLPNRVDCFARGFDILAGFSSSEPVSFGGASAAVPLVTGALALLKNRSNLKGADLRKYFIETQLDTIPALSLGCAGYFSNLK